MVKGSVPQQQPQTKIYMGNKLSGNNTIQKGNSFKVRKFGNGGCGCGKTPKKPRN
jgi:hypothetical protein